MRIKILLAVALIGFSALGISTVVHRDNKLKFQQVELQSKQAEIKQLQLDYQVLDKKQTEVEKKNDTSQEELNKLKQEKEELLKRQEELEQQLSVKKQQQTIAQSKIDSRASVTATASASTVNCGDNQYKQYIYQKESGCHTCKINGGAVDCWYTGNRAFGIGQATDGKVLHCGGDFACQDAWFSNYAVSRYGSWEGAYNFWIQNHWW